MVLVNNKHSPTAKSNRGLRSESNESFSSTINVGDANLTKKHINDNDTINKVHNTPDIIIELNSTSCPKVQSLLNAYKGHLVDVGSCLLESLRNTAPQQLAARVGL
eukprot:scaffold18411_cov85-Skeletonema_dohrnii-CCMP3373.AAC.2